MQSRSVAALVTAAIALSYVTAVAAKKKKPEKEVTQVLDLPKDPPQAVVADSTRLVFHVAPISAKGLLSQQMRDGVKALLSATRGSSIVKVRAFVAGSGDLRRVPQIISEIFTDRKLSLPAVSVVQVGALPLEGAQVVLESTSVDKKPVTPNGVAFVSGQRGTTENAPAPVMQVLEKAGLKGGDVRRVTCFLYGLDRVSDVRTQMAQAFPKAVSNFVQLRRDSAGDFVECEAVAALTKAPEQRLTFIGAKPKEQSDAALAGPGKLALTGTQLAFNSQDTDVRLAFDRMQKALDSVHGDLKKAAFVSVYPLTKSISDKIRSMRFDYLDAAHPPATTALLFEGLPALDASFAFDVVSASEMP